MNKLQALIVFLVLGSVQLFQAQTHPSQFSVPSAKQTTALQAAANARAQARSAAMPERLTSAPGSSSAPNAAGKTRSARSHPYGNPPLNPPLNPVGFLSAVPVPAGGLTLWPAVYADFNNDGKLDIAAPVETSSTPLTFAVSVLLNNGGGSFQAASFIPNPNGSYGDQILVGDVNGDGIPDLLIVHSSAPSTFEVFLANGSGSFSQVGGLNPISSTFPAAGVLTDVNNDGKLDLLIIDTQKPANLWTILGDGTGNFSAPTSVTLTGGLLSNIVFADFNGDGVLDFAAVDSNTGQNVIYLAQVNGLGQGTGAYLAGTPLSNPDGYYYICNNAAGNLIPGSKPDLVSANCKTLLGTHNGPGNLSVYLNNGDGTFQTGVYYSSGTELTDDTNPSIYPVAVTIADVNGDGNNDIISSNADGGDVTVLLGKGDGTVTVPTVGYDTGGFPSTSALVADFNGDGVPDIVIPDDDFSFAYLQGYGDGTFRSAIDTFSPVPGGFFAGGTTLASGDLNGDGIPDFVVGNYGYNPSTPSGMGITVFLSNPDGSMQKGVNYATGGSYQGVALAHFNNTAKLDIAAVNQSNNGVQIFNGNGDGTFANGQFFPTGGSGATVIVAGDFNQDGLPDFATLNVGSQNISVLLNQGSGTFSSPATYPISAPGVDIVAADVNGDGIPDLLVSQTNQGVDVFLGVAGGTFKPATTTPLGLTSLGNLALGDLNGDGIPDLAVVVDDTSVGTGVAVARGNGDGTFQPPVLYSTTVQNVNLALPLPGAVQMIDLNGDGKLDLVYTNRTYGTVGVLYNTGANPFAAGMFYDPVEYPAGSEVFALALADVNGDGAVDVVAADNNYAGLTVLLNATGSLSTLLSSVNPAAVTQPVTFTATVAANVRGVITIPTGTVTFFDAVTTNLGSAPLNSSGVATFTDSSLAIGTHSITAVYSGDSNFHTSTSTATSQVVTIAADTNALLSSLNPAGAGQSVTFTATISPSTSGVTAMPTGTVTFFDAGTSIGSAPLTAGVAAFTTSSLAIGTHPITAQYPGDANFSASTSSALSQSIVQPDFTLGANPATDTVNPGSNAQYTITITPSNGYSGTVSFSCPASLPSKIGCSFNPTSSAPSSGSYPTTTLTLSTQGGSASFVAPARPNSKPFAPTLWASLSGVGVFGLVFAGIGRKRNRLYMAILGMILLAVMFTAVGCGSGSNNGGQVSSGTPPGNYIVTVTATGTGTGSPTHTMNVTLVVQ